VLNSLGGLPRFKPPPRRIRTKVWILDGAQPISSLLEVTRQPRRFELTRQSPGKSAVICNIGGRINPGLLEKSALLARIGEAAGEIPGGGGQFHLVVLQHTHCGITRLAGDPAKLAHYFQIQEGEFKTKAVTDPRAAVAVDVAALRAIPALPSAWLISGLVYDVATGLVEIVVPPAPIRTA
jgi:carbonic anhydrase